MNFVLSFLVASAVAQDDPCFPGSTATKQCKTDYDRATTLCAGQVATPPKPLPPTDLINLSGRTQLDIVYCADHAMQTGTSGPEEVTEEIWFTAKEQQVPYMSKAISEMDFSGKSKDDVNVMLAQRLNASVGMSTAGDVLVNLGKIEVKQMDPSATDKNGGFFRPCWNNYHIDNTDCKYVENQVPYVKKHAKASYDLNSPDEFPFTGLGWTFDWMAWEHSGSETEKAIGLNEFVILPERGTVVTWEASLKPVDYFCQICVQDNDCGNFGAWAKQNGCNDSPPKSLMV